MDSKPQSNPTNTGQGGRREGAGRPAGAMSKLAKEAREQAKLTGELPHEILLKMARGLPVKTYIATDQIDADGEPVFAEKFVALDVEGIRDAAKAAAPYFAPKISTVEVITGVSDDDLNSIIAGAAAEAKVGVSFNGESTPAEVERPSRTRLRASPPIDS